MREILFRGRPNDGSWWVFGDLIHRRICKYDIVIIRTEDSGFDNYNEYKVVPETVGQYTGLTDKNGKKIFEGDIVQAYFRSNHSKQTFCVCFDDGMFLFDNDCVKIPKYGIYAMEVIGNIHDNPELLGVRQWLSG